MYIVICMDPQELLKVYSYQKKVLKYIYCVDTSLSLSLSLSLSHILPRIATIKVDICRKLLMTSKEFQKFYFKLWVIIVCKHNSQVCCMLFCCCMSHDCILSRQSVCTMFPNKNSDHSSIFLNSFSYTCQGTVK